MSLEPPKQHIVINRKRFTLEFWQRDKDAEPLDYNEPFVCTHQFQIAVGMQGRRTNPGLYFVATKDDSPEWTMPSEDWVPKEKWGTVVAADDPLNPIKARWIGFNPLEAEGIHGTAADDSIGTRASHGCVRMHVEDVIELFDMVEKGCLVYVI